MTEAVKEELKAGKSNALFFYSSKDILWTIDEMS